MAHTHKSTQRTFDEQWISAGELCQTLNVTTGTLCLAIKRGTFPEPDVRVRGGLGLWDRITVADAIARWRGQLCRIRNMRAQILTPSTRPPWVPEHIS